RLRRWRRRFRRRLERWRRRLRRRRRLGAMVMDLARTLRHLLTPAWRVRSAFPPAALRAVEAAIRAAEATHHGQICFAVEAALELKPLLAGQSARARALEVFAQQRVWDTERNNGVLIYLLLADRDVEIVADRGVHARADAHAWEYICREIEAQFRAGDFKQGAVNGVRAVGALLAQHYPGAGPEGNELPDR